MASPLQKAIFNWETETLNRNSTIRLQKLDSELLELQYAYHNGNWFIRGFDTHKAAIADEIANVYLLLLAFAESLEIDVEKVGTTKLKELKERTYESINGVWTKVPNAGKDVVDANPGRNTEDDSNDPNGATDGGY